jgi:hypothetical protein
MDLRTYTIGAAIVWAALLLAAALVLQGTPHFGQLLPVLAGGAVWFVVLVPGSWKMAGKTPVRSRDA